MSSNIPYSMSLFTCGYKESSSGSSVRVVICGISAEWIGFSYANGDGLSVAGVILS